MIAPLSWLKEYVDITLTPKELGEKLTEVGLGVEKITKTSDDTIFELEITPNRPDLLSIIGIAREIAAIENKKIKYPKPKTNLEPTAKILPMIITTDSSINPRFTGIIIKGVAVKESPAWLKEKLQSINQRPINNIVDITNYVMFELGNPLHAFDYDKIEGHEMHVKKAQGTEKFISVDGLSYVLPKNAVIISDKKKVIDLCGIKGGQNSATTNETKTVFIRVPVEDPVLIRLTSQSMGLRSQASSIFERGVNKGGTVDALKRCVDLILEIAGGTGTGASAEVASSLYDIGHDFKSWKLKLRKERLNKILGIEIPAKKTLEILEALNLLPISTKDNIECTIPTYRNDLKIEEDLIEEVARLYGYNNFPKTLPIGQIPTKTIPYFKDYNLDEKVKQIFRASSFSEIYTYSLISESDLSLVSINPDNVIRIDNPISREFEYLRPTLKINLTKALYQNKANFNKKINLFELGKVYLGKNLDEVREEYFLSGISNEKNFFEIKGIIERLFEEIEVREDPSGFIETTEEGIFFEINISEVFKKMTEQKAFIPLPKYPPIIEDLNIVARENIKTLDLMKNINDQSNLIKNVSLLDQFEDSRTFHITYQHKDRNLTNEEVAKIREKILKSLKEKFNARLKE